MVILLFGVTNIGKTVTGSKLAERINYSFYDLDDVIKKKFNTTLDKFIKDNPFSYERGRLKGKILSDIIMESTGDIVIAVSPIYYSRFFNKLLDLDQVIAIELQDSKENIFQRLVFSNEEDNIYKDDDGVFYAVTNGTSNKMLQIAQNSEVSVAGCLEMFTANGLGENLGWVLQPENADIRQKLRAAFSAWYDIANNEQDKNCRILAIHLIRGTLNINHWEKLYHMDFVNKSIMENGGIY